LLPGVLGIITGDVIVFGGAFVAMEEAGACEDVVGPNILTANKVEYCSCVYEDNV